MPHPLQCFVIFIGILSPKFLLQYPEINTDTHIVYFLFIQHQFLEFLPARRYASVGLCDSDVSVHLSVRLSVTRRYCA